MMSAVAVTLTSGSTSLGHAPFRLMRSPWVLERARWLEACSMPGSLADQVGPVAGCVFRFASPFGAVVCPPSCLSLLALRGSR